MGYWAYYLLSFGLAFATQYPAVAALAVVFFLLRGYLPDPVVWLRTASRMRTLDAQVQANPQNVTARRDLARIYLQRMRPRKALALLDEARKRHPDDPELLYFTGLARLRSGDAAGALDPIVRAVDAAPGVLYGAPYLVAADALARLGKMEEAEDALERFLRSNGSALEGYVKLARVRSALGDGEGARAALREARATFDQVPAFKKREQLGWWVVALVTRIWT